jgi:hypothetical protein
MLSPIVERITKVMPDVFVAFWAPQDQNEPNILTIKEEKGLGITQLEFAQIDVTDEVDSPVAQAMKMGNIIVEGSPTSDDFHRKQKEQGVRWSNLWAYPVKRPDSEQSTIGVLCFYPIGGYLTTRDQNFAILFTELIANSLEYERRTDHLQTVNNIGRLLMSTLDRRGVLRELMGALIKHFQVERASFWSVDNVNQCVEFQFSLNKEGIEDEISKAIRDLGAFPIGLP